MPQTLTVVVTTSDPGTALSTVVAGLDSQTLHTDEFDVVVADAGSVDGSRERLERLAGCRPNLAVLIDADLAAGVAAASGTYVLVIDQQTRVLPEALARMRIAAADGDADVVVGRRLHGAGSTGPLQSGADEATQANPAGVPTPLPPELVSAWSDAALLVRRERLVAAVTERSQGWPAAVLAGAGRVAVVPDYACLVSPGTTEPEPVTTRAVPDPALCTWTGAALRIEVDVPDGLAPGHHVALVLARSDGSEHALPTTCTLVSPARPEPPADGETTDSADATGTPAETGLRVVGKLTVAGPEHNSPTDGVYRVRLRSAAPPGEAIDLPAGRPAPALVSGRAVVVGGGQDGLRIDLGATAAGLVTRLAVDDATIQESARGSLLRVPLPDLYVDGPGRLGGVVALGGLRLPAELVVPSVRDGRGGEVRCYVSGLEGRSAVSVQFAGSGLVTTGVDLVTSNVGEFTLEPTPAAAPKPATAQATAQAKKTKKAPARPPTRLQKLRRAVPAPLEPVARALSSVGPARALYRRLSRR
ncbi:MAG: glycosyltransferase [Propionibacteriaceae bacterium]